MTLLHPLSFTSSGHNSQLPSAIPLACCHPPLGPEGIGQCIFGTWWEIRGREGTEGWSADSASVSRVGILKNKGLWRQKGCREPATLTEQLQEATVAVRVRGQGPGRPEHSPMGLTFRLWRSWYSPVANANVWSFWKLGPTAIGTNCFKSEELLWGQWQEEQANPFSHLKPPVSNVPWWPKPTWSKVEKQNRLCSVPAQASQKKI